MIKSTNKFTRYNNPHYTNLINVWVDDVKRIDIVKVMMLSNNSLLNINSYNKDKNNKVFRLEKLKLNPVYKDVYEVITNENKKELQKLDNSLIWSRFYKKKDFFDFVIPFCGYAFIFIPYIFYKVLHKRILERHVKYGYDAENLKPYNYWNLDFKNKDIYPDSVIELYFDIKKIKKKKEEEVKKLNKYNESFKENMTTKYITDLANRRIALGFNDEDDY